MYTLEVTPDEWGLVYRAGNRTPEPRPAWAEGLINSPIWDEGVCELSFSDTRRLVAAFRADITDDEDAFPELDTNTLLFFKLHQLWVDFDLDRKEDNE